MMTPLTRAGLALVLVLALALPVRAQNVNVRTSVLQQYVDGIEALLSTVAGDTTDIETAIELLDNAAGITPSDNFANPTGALVVYALTGCWDGSTWDRCTGSSADTELPVAVAAADNMANPTGPFVLAASMCWDGATWDRCSGTSADTELPTAATLADNTANPSLPAVAAYMMAYDGTTWDRARLATDPCAGPKTYVNINQATGTQLLAGTASNRTYICHLSLVTATAQNIALVNGTGTVCATGIAGMSGGSTASTGWNFVANGGLALGNGDASLTKSTADAANVCLLQSSTGQVSGVMGYVVAVN